jgi:hypothetical protein
VSAACLNHLSDDEHEHDADRGQAVQLHQRRDAREQDPYEQPEVGYEADEPDSTPMASAKSSRRRNRPVNR